jgi:NDP-sugar pyrophosphorylase family protein
MFHVLTTWHPDRRRANLLVVVDVSGSMADPAPGTKKPLISLVSQGVEDLVLNLHHRPASLTARLGDGRDLGARVRYSWELPRILGSAGGPRLARAIVGADPFLIVNGDTLTDLDLGALGESHVASGALVTLALVPNREFERYGGVLLDAEGRVTGFVRRGPSAAGSYHYIGVQVAQASAFDAVRPGERASSIGEVYDALMTARPGSVRGFVCSAEFWDVGTTEDYWRTSAALAARSHTADLGIGRGARIDPSARVMRSILWDDVQIGADAVIEDCILTDGVRVAAGAVHHGEILIHA